MPAYRTSRSFRQNLAGKVHRAARNGGRQSAGRIVLLERKSDTRRYIRPKDASNNLHQPTQFSLNNIPALRGLEISKMRHTMPDAKRRIPETSACSKSYDLQAAVTGRSYSQQSDP
ncbi:hypothetical protein RRG08_012211 [Elysia crispata]|uniref:Uncharacterized protein n=1 Tax=Elysia crispata TaxID=231223 RepID=A0AAE0Z647_9GAST|nr:hypothetical protein RRG08_012211 [Elysia crispata]